MDRGGLRRFDRPKRATRLRAVFGLLAMLASTAAAADPVADFYKGRTITLIIGSGEGGGYDISGRLAAEFLSRYIPGHPTVVPQNMPGASGIRAAEYMFRVAAQDGTAISVPEPSVLMNKVLDARALYEPEKFSWIGRFSTLKTYGVVWHTAPVQSVAAAKMAPLILGAAPGVGLGTTVTSALNQLIGTRFVVVRGYKSVSESGLAMERGEVEGISSTSWEYLQSKGWIGSKEIAFLYVIGLSRNSNIPDTPTIVELTDKVEDRDVLKFIASGSEIGRAILAPPNVPTDRVDALRAAFAELVKDPDFISASAQRKLDVGPLPGADLQNLVAAVMKVSPSVVETAQHILQK
jgi:tripartite-type tricarboxylate transporter receptor subunit TctC